MEAILIERRSEDSIPSRRLRSDNGEVSKNIEENLHPNTRESRSGNSADFGQKSTGASSSSAEFNKLSGELNSRITREMDEMMNSVSVQIQRAISDAIINQVLPQIQNALEAGAGHVTQKGWNVPADSNNVEDFMRKIHICYRFTCVEFGSQRFWTQIGPFSREKIQSFD